MIISVHMPKCGGSSFKELLDRQFQRRVLEDNDYPIHKSFAERTGEAERAAKWIEFTDKYLLRYNFTECIHGHFLPYKYHYFHGKKDTVFVTWLRDPIERLGSHYYFWKRTYSPWNPKPLHKKVIKENWSLEKFAFSEEIQNIYSKFLWNFPVENFDFIGITEFFEEDLTYFGNRYLDLNRNVTIPEKNVNPERSKKYFDDEKLIQDLRDFHSRDYEIYNYALQARKDRTTFQPDIS